MGVPKKRLPKGRRNKRRMHLYLEKPSLVKCPKCGKPVLPHTICWNCGYYKEVEVIDVLKKLTKKERKRREREMAAEEKEKAKTSAQPSSSPERAPKSLSWEELSKK